MNKFALFVSALFLLTSTKLQATAIIAIIYPNRVILAVDSRLVYTNGITGQKRYGTGQKLSLVNSYAFAFTGYRGHTGSINSAYRNFNTDLFLKGILNKPGNSVNQVIAEVADGLGKELTAQMKTMRKSNFRDYSSYLNSYKGNMMNLVIVGSDNGIPFACAMNVVLSEVKGVPETQVIGSVFKNKSTIIHAGVTDAVAKYLNANPHCHETEEPITLIDKLMKLTIEDKPLDAAYPVNIIEASKNGIKWLRQ